MTYEIGDSVVHPQHGIATVEGTVQRDVGRGPEDYLQLHVKAPSLEIMVPVDAVNAVGIRDLSTKTEAQELLAILEEPSEVSENWSERNVSTTARVRSHHLDQMSMVVRDLSRHQRRATKPLTLNEKNVLDQCLDIVAGEISVALAMSEEDTKALILEKSLKAQSTE